MASSHGTNNTDELSADGSIDETTSPADQTTPTDEDSSASGGESSPFTLEEVMESVVRITLAGLGGSMLGLSQERKLESMRVVTGAAATAAARRKRAPSAQLANLPLTWSVSCMAFCAIVEASRRMAPSSRIISAVFEDRSFDTNGTSSSNSSSDETKSSYVSKINPRIQSFLGTVADFTIGGAVGGFAASMGRNTHLRKQLPSSMLRGSQRYFGVVPGLSLGLLAGIIQASTDTGISYLEQLQQEEDSTS